MKRHTEANAFGELEPMPWKSDHATCWQCAQGKGRNAPRWSVTDASVLKRRWACARHLHQVCKSMGGPLYIEGMLDA